MLNIADEHFKTTIINMLKDLQEKLKEGAEVRNLHRKLKTSRKKKINGNYRIKKYSAKIKISSASLH